MLLLLLLLATIAEMTAYDITIIIII